MREEWYLNKSRVRSFVALLAVDRAYGRGLDKEDWDVRRHKEEIVSEDVCINAEETRTWPS